MNNLYIALSTHHLSYCEKIASEKTKDNNILITSNNFEIDKSVFSRIVLLNNTVYNQSSSILSKIKNVINKTANYRKVIDQINDLKTETKLTLYYSSLEDVLSNYLLFSFSDNIRGVIIEDGVLNYYHHSFKDVSNFNFYLKKIIAFSFGLKLKSYEGHTSGIDYDHVKYQLVREPNYSIRPNKSKILPKNKRNLSVLNDNILIVGQEPYAAVCGKKVYIDKLTRLAFYIKADRGYHTKKTVFYKSHRHGPRIDIESIKQMFSDNPFIYLDEDLSMEDLFFNKIKCKNIYTFDSSAVFSIYSDSPLEIRESLNINVMPFNSSVLNSLFTKLNFRIIKDDI